MNSFLRNTYQYFYIFTIFFFVILLVNAINGQSSVYGWVNAANVSK